MVVTDSGGLAATRDITITVRPVIHEVLEPITVTDSIVINGAPMLGPLFDQTVDTGTAVTFTAVAIDPGDTDVFLLVNAPAGASIDPLTGIFNWTPAEAQGGSSYTFGVIVTDSGGLTAARAITITVRPMIHELAEPITVTDAVTINGAPMLDPLADRTVNAGTPVTFTAVVTDPGDTHVFSLVNAPPGASIDPQTGAFNWTPTLAQSPGVYSFAVGVTDSGGLYAERPITITTLAAPVLPTVTVTAPDDSSAEGTAGATGTFTVTRTGGDLNSALAVQLTIGGTATPNTDFTFSANFATSIVVIPPGLLTADITVTPIDDTIADGDETVVVTLDPSVVYVVGAPSAATVTIGDDDLVVTNINDSGVGSLRQAILDANSRTGVTDTIRFDIPGAGPHTIAPDSPLPVITDPVVIDGTTQPGYLPSMLAIEIAGSNAGPAANGLVVAGGNSVIRGLVINLFGAGGTGAGGAAVVLQTGGSNVILGNFIGTDPTGFFNRPNRGAGISIELSSQNVIGGLAADANIIAFNGGPGVSILSGTGNQVFGNAIRSIAPSESIWLETASRRTIRATRMRTQ